MIKIISYMVIKFKKMKKRIKGYIVFKKKSLIGEKVSINGEVRVGKNCVVDPYTRLNAEPIIEVGNNFYVNVFCWIAGEITIGDDVLIGPHVRIIGRDHGIAKNFLISQQERVYKKITIKNDVWIGGGRYNIKGCYYWRRCSNCSWSSGYKGCS